MQTYTVCYSCQGSGARTSMDAQGVFHVATCPACNGACLMPAKVKA